MLRATAVTGADTAVAVGDHAFTVHMRRFSGATVVRCACPAAQATVPHLARLGDGAIRDAAFGVRTEWTHRVTGCRQVAEVRSAEYAAHAGDTVVG